MTWLYRGVCCVQVYSLTVPAVFFGLPLTEVIVFLHTAYSLTVFAVSSLLPSGSFQPLFFSLFHSYSYDARAIVCLVPRVRGVLYDFFCSFFADNRSETLKFVFLFFICVSVLVYLP